VDFSISLSLSPLILFSIKEVLYLHLRDVSVSSGRMAIRKQAFYVQVCKE
jgi:hypothetical protein